MSSTELRSYVFLDNLQPQHAAFLGTIAGGFLPLPGDASLWIEISPGIEINRITDVALKATNVWPAVQIVERLFDGEHFIHLPPSFRRTNTNDGCHIDQMLGQSFALQVGLPRVVPEREAGSALRALWRHNFTPDAGGYRNAMQKTIPGGRWYAMPGEAGLLLCTWPRGGAEKAGAAGTRPSSATSTSA